MNEMNDQSFSKTIEERDEKLYKEINLEEKVKEADKIIYEKQNSEMTYDVKNKNTKNNDYTSNTYDQKYNSSIYDSKYSSSVYDRKYSSSVYDSKYSSNTYDRKYNSSVYNKSYLDKYDYNMSVKEAVIEIVNELIDDPSMFSDKNNDWDLFENKDDQSFKDIFKSNVTKTLKKLAVETILSKLVSENLDKKITNSKAIKALAISTLKTIKER